MEKNFLTLLQNNSSLQSNTCARKLDTTIGYDIVDPCDCFIRVADDVEEVSITMNNCSIWCFFNTFQPTTISRFIIETFSFEYILLSSSGYEPLIINESSFKGYKKCMSYCTLFVITICLVFVWILPNVDININSDANAESNVNSNDNNAYDPVDVTVYDIFPIALSTTILSGILMVGALIVYWMSQPGEIPLFNHCACLWSVIAFTCALLFMFAVIGDGSMSETDGLWIILVVFLSITSVACV